MEVKNKSARIRVVNRASRSLRVTYSLVTAGRDSSSLTARVDVRERSDVNTGKSFRGLSVKTSSGRTFRFTGNEARTLYRLLSQAVE